MCHRMWVVQFRSGLCDDDPYINGHAYKVYRLDMWTPMSGGEFDYFLKSFYLPVYDLLPSYFGIEIEDGNVDDVDDISVDAIGVSEEYSPNFLWLEEVSLLGKSLETILSEARSLPHHNLDAKERSERSKDVGTVIEEEIRSYVRDASYPRTAFSETPAYLEKAIFRDENVISVDGVTAVRIEPLKFIVTQTYSFVVAVPIEVSHITHTLAIPTKNALDDDPDPEDCGRGVWLEFDYSATGRMEPYIRYDPEER